ncbi:hypothetical protein Lalb_Chr21g0310211 [Lupinus albus]|uniref:Uncharacterized protein n=1 Tax=Lupinus albus TaxID=3870 RepID=A0A6A4NJ95_LUPAL|nr:hypothetical protein Lalb_Chr21g0310211 [Lupinus albus]
MSIFKFLIQRICICLVKVGIPKFVNGIRKGVESHVAKLENM